MNQLSEKQLSFDCAMKIVNKQKWIQIKDIERLENFIQNQQAAISALKEENEQLKSLVNACEYGQKNLMKEMENSDEALDKIWEIMKELYGVVDDE